MKIMEVFMSSFNFFMSSRTSFWIVTSRAVVGSSAIKSLGEDDRAMAIIILCLIPPESSWGYEL